MGTGIRAVIKLLWFGSLMLVSMNGLSAAHHLVVDFHGAYPPTGLRRTYPKLLSREGVMGMEYNKWNRRETPEHQATIPFTRMLAGPMDYTPGRFDTATREQFVPREIQPMCQGTRANQLAMHVMYLSPLEMVSDYPEDLYGKPGFDFIKKHRRCGMKHGC